MAVTPLQVSEAFGRVAQASSVEAANILLGDELAPLFNQGASGEGFSEFESPVGDPIQIDLSFPLVTISTRDSGVVPGTYGSSAEIPFFTVDVFGRVTEAGSFSLSSLPASGPASGDLSGTYPSPTVTGLRGHVLPAVNGTPGNLRWDGIGWALDFQPYALSGHTHPYLPIDNPTFTGTMSGPALKLSDAGVGVGILSWSSQEHTAELTLENGSVLQIGKESLQWCKDGTGAGLTHGQLVYVSGSTGDNPVVRLADADDPAAYETIGMVTQPIAPNGEGFVATSISFVRGLNLSGYTVGQAVYLSTTPGAFVATAPSKPGRRVRVGFVLRAHAVQGIILLWVDRPGALRDLDDVDTSGAFLGNALTIAADGVWRPTAVLPAANPTFTGTLTGPSIRVTGLSNSFVKSDASGSLVNGTISVSDLPSHTHAYLPIGNPTFTGTLTGPTQRLEGDVHLMLSLRRPGGFTSRTHGVAFMAQTLDSTWVEFGRVMAYISSVANGAQTGGIRLSAYNAGAETMALEAGPTAVRVGAGLPLQMDATTVIDSSRNGSFAGLAASGAITANGAIVQTWGTGYKPVSIGLGSSIVAKNWPGGDTLYLFNNVYRAAGDVTKAIAGTGNCSALMLHETGGMSFSTSANPGAGATASLVEKFSVDATGALALNATTRITAGGDGRFATLRASDLSAAAVRPATIGIDGTLGAQDPATFLTTIGASSSSHTHAYLPIDNPTFTGRLSGNDVKIGSPSSGGWLQLVANSTATSAFSIDFLGGAATKRRMTVRWSDSADYFLIMSSNDDGTARQDRLIIPRSASLPIAIGGDLTATNITGSTIKVLNAVGTGSRPLVALADGTIEDESIAAFLSLIGAASASHTHSYLPISNPAFTGMLTGPDISLSGALIASQVYTSSNGSGSNVKIGDDLWIGDINQANTVGLSGVQNSTIAHIRFGSSGPTFGYNGTSFIMSNMAGSGTRFLVVGASGDISNLVYNGPWLPLSGAARVSGWVAFDAVVYPTATVNFSGYTLSQFGLYAHTAFTFSGGGITFEDTVLFGGSVSFDVTPTFTRSLTLPFVGYTAILGALGSNIYPIPVASATVYLASGSSSSHRNYSAPYLADGQIIVIHGKPYGAPINAPQLYASSGCTIYDASGTAVADDTSPISVNGVIIAQCYGGDLYILNRGDTAL